MNTVILFFEQFIPFLYYSCYQVGITDGSAVIVQFCNVQSPCQDLLSKSHCPCSRTSLCLANGCCYEGTVPSLSGSHLIWMFVCWWEVFELCAKFKWSIDSWNSGTCACLLSFTSLLSVATSCDVKCRDVAVSLKSCNSNIVRILKLAGIKSTLLVQIHLQCSPALCKYFLLLCKL